MQNSIFLISDSNFLQKLLSHKLFAGPFAISIRTFFCWCFHLFWETAVLSSALFSTHFEPLILTVFCALRLLELVYSCWINLCKVCSWWKFQYKTVQLDRSIYIIKSLADCNLLNQRSELVSKCRHQKELLLCNVERNSSRDCWCL